MNDQNTKHWRRAFGFLTVSILLGIACGFAPMDVRAGLGGYDWTSEHYLWQTLIAMSFGGGFGLVAGWILDAVVKEETQRNRVLGRLWKLFILGVIVFSLIRPGLQNARE